MVSKSEQLEQLFIEWEYAQENEPDSSWKLTQGGENITKSHFRRDGIIDEAVFSKEKRKVLFISNEPNDNNYSAKSNSKPSNIDDYRKYYETGYDDWKGKMRERTSAIYKVVAGIKINEMSDSDAAIHYAVMDLNKRGGGSVAKVERIQEYCKYYKEFIKREIEIINPDVIVWLGTNTYDKKLHINYLGAKKIDDKIYFFIDDKQIPILRMWHTSYRWKGGIEPLQGYADERIGRLCAKCRKEMKRYNLI